MLTTILAFLVALGILIAFHEYGHYWAARRCGVRVLRFSLGFGKPIWTRTDRRGTEWALAAIPLGGYVKMVNDANDPEHGLAGTLKPGETFDEQSVWRRFFIVVAGPVANFILAAVIYIGLGMYGVQEPEAILGQPEPNTPAAQAGIVAFDRVIAVNNEPIQSWPELGWALMDPIFSGDTVDLEVESGGLAVHRQLNLSGIAQQADATDQNPLALTGLIVNPGPVRLGQIMSEGAGQRAGLQEGDIIEAAGSLENPRVLDFIEVISNHPQSPLTLRVLREGSRFDVVVTPDLVKSADGFEIGRLGVGVGEQIPMVLVRQGLLGSVTQAITRTFSTAWFSVKMLGKMVMGDVSLKNLSGPVTIADHAGKSAQMGLIVYLNFVALVSISIGVLNLLPIPLLDGGHLAFYVVEMVRGRPAPESWIVTSQKAGAAVLAGLMMVALLNDFTRLLS